VASVRAKALANLALIFEESSTNKQLADSTKLFNDLTSSELRSAFNMDSNTAEPNGNKTDIFSLLHRRAADDKPSVRKASLQVSAASLLTQRFWKCWDS